MSNVTFFTGSNRYYQNQIDFNSETWESPLMGRLKKLDRNSSLLYLGSMGAAALGIITAFYSPLYAEIFFSGVGCCTLSGLLLDSKRSSLAKEHHIDKNHDEAIFKFRDLFKY